MPGFNIRALALMAQSNYTPGGSNNVSVFNYSTTDALATVLTAGYFNEARDKGKIKANDLVLGVANAGGAGAPFIVRFSAVPSSGNVEAVAADFADDGIGTRAVVPTAANGGATGQILMSDRFVEATSANANHILTLPAASAATRGKEIWIWVVAGTNCELQTGGAGNTINNVDCSGGAVEALLTHTQLYVVRQHLATGWLLQAFTALGAVATAIVPD